MLEFEFEAEVILWSGDKAAWHFAVLPIDLSEAIEDTFSDVKGGWGSIKVAARTGTTSWSTSIFPSKEREAYVLPLKKAVRDSEDITAGDTVSFTLEI